MQEYKLNGHILQFDEETHTYLVDNIVVPSITTILHETKFKNKYKNIDEKVLKKAGELGTAMHKSIEEYEKNGTEVNTPEFNSYKTIKRLYGFEVLESEIPVIIEYEGQVVCAGMLDQIIEMPILERRIRCVNDFKRTSTFDKEYLAFQETMYAIGYEQTYGCKIDKLFGTHLRNDKRKFVEIKRNDELAMNLIKQYVEKNKEENFLN